MMDAAINRSGSESVMILGCGYVGRPMAQYWRSQGLTVTGTTTTPDRLAELADCCDRALCLRGDDEAGLRSALAGQTTLLVCLGPRRSGIYRETYLHSAQTLAQLLPELPQLRQVIYTSSYGVYGDRGGAWVDETTPPQPTTDNGQILLETEQVLLGAARDGLAVCVFRLGGICGPGREVADIFRSASGQGRPGSGQDWSNWIHLDDIVGAIAFARAARLSGLYNLVHDEPLTQAELLDRAFRRRGWPGVTWNSAESAQRPYNARVSNQKLKTAGYQFRSATIPL